MEKLSALFGALFVSVLAACSGADDTSPAASEAPPQRQGTAAAVESEPATAPCPEANAPAAPDAAAPGPKRTPSPVELCEGSYRCSGLEGTGPAGAITWLHSDGKQCFFGSYGIVMHPDGTVTSSDDHGTWTGDSAYFQIDLKGIAYMYSDPWDSTSCKREALQD